MASLYLPFTETAAEAVTSEEPQGPEKVQLQSGGGGGTQPCSQPLSSDLDTDCPAQQ